jgi:hypothetical protein
VKVTCGVEGRRRIVDRSINMGLGGKMQNGIGLKRRDDAINGDAIRDISLFEADAWALKRAGKGLPAGRIRQLVENTNISRGITKQQAHDRRSNKSCPTCD